MTHEHGNQLQVRIEHADGTEELSGWMQTQEEVMRAIAALHGSPARTYWLRVRNIRCLKCTHPEVPVVEFPLNPAAGGNTRQPPQAEKRSPSFSASRVLTAGA
jgi:hypothetical protein